MSNTASMQISSKLSQRRLVTRLASRHQVGCATAIQNQISLNRPVRVRLRSRIHGRTPSIICTKEIECYRGRINLHVGSGSEQAVGVSAIECGSITNRKHT